MVELTERLIGKGYDVKVYDRNVSLACIHGANRDYILNKIPHLSRLMVPTIDEVLAHAPDHRHRQRRAGVRRRAQAHRRGPDRDRLRARVRLAHRGRRLRGPMLVGGIALRAPLRLSSRKKTDDPYAMLEARFTPRTVFMEIGSPDASPGAARGGLRRARVFDRRLRAAACRTCARRATCALVLCDGMRIPVPEAAIDIAWSGDFMDHLHADEPTAHLESVRAAW